jgi:hypothetical protein
MIQRFTDEHSTACAKNWVCTKLQLAQAVVRPMSPPMETGKKHARSPSVKSPKVIKKTRLDYILIDE